MKKENVNCIVQLVVYINNKYTVYIFTYGSVEVCLDFLLKIIGETLNFLSPVSCSCSMYRYDVCLQVVESTIDTIFKSEISPLFKT